MQGLAQDYKTKTFIQEKKMPKIMGNNQYKAKTIVAYDGGYSSNKGVGGDRVYCFPSIVKPILDLRITGEMKDTDIIITDNKTGRMFLVGDFAYEQMMTADIKKLNDETLYDQYWYESEEFEILSAVGICMGLPKNYAKTDIYIQTGLPCEHLKAGKNKMISVLGRDYDYTLQVGNSTPEVFKFTPVEVHVMEQPQGTLYNALYDSKCQLIKDRKYLSSTTTVIHDVGFGTEDDYSIRGPLCNFHKTYSDTAMKAVFDSVLDEINSKLPTPIQTFELQKHLDRGAIKYYERGVGHSEIAIGELLNKSNTRLNKKAFDRLMRLCDDFVDVKTLIVTGGTGESRFEDIKEMFEGMDTAVLAGNENDKSLPFALSNVLGYYKRLFIKLSKDVQASTNA